MGHHRGKRINREGKKHYRECDKCSEIELTSDDIFNCPANIPHFLKIGALPTKINLYKDINELIAMAIFDVHGYI